MSGERPPVPCQPHPVRPGLGVRRLLGAVGVVLLVPAALGVAAWNHDPPARPPTTTALRHPALPQVPDSVARAQLERSAAASRAARKLTAPQLLTAPGANEDRGALPTLALAPREAAYSLAELRTLVPDAFSPVNPRSAVEGAAGAVLLGAHIEVPLGATLMIDSRTPDVRLTSRPSGFATIISRGTTTVTGTATTPVRISSWDPQRRAPDPEASDGRSFVLQIGGRMDAAHGRFEHLGFGTGTSSGVAWRGAAPNVAGSAPDARRVRVQGSVTDSVFAHNHFGAYTHEAQGMRWTRNTFFANEEYGFDPHDFSNDFVVEHNTAHHNGKHGIIFSRGCLRNVVRNNTAYANAGHGIMIDDGRSAATATSEVRISPSDDNLVIDNTAHDNAGSGVEIEGGSRNVVSGNRLTRNDIGVRIKDRAVATVRGNTIDGSVRYGVHVLDPAARASITDNHISGTWAAVNLAAAHSATLGANPSADVSTPLVVHGVADRNPSWLDRAVQYVRWNPLLVLWALILGVPALAVALRAGWAPVVRRRERT